MTIAAPPRINFPVFTTPLIGRDADVATIVGRLRRSPRRFATLVGTSGTGKTRLSMQIASAMEGDFPDGMAFVPLASITDPALVIPTIARTLGLAETTSDTFGASLSSHIGGQTMLLILDNFEQVVEAAPAIVELLAHMPNTHVLCTSQIPTHLANEEVIPIPPLALPNRADSLEALEASPAVALFVERMRHIQPQFALTPHNASAVSELCRRLHGLPLAIELVATHSERLQPEDLLLLLRAYLPQERNRRDALSPDEVIFPVLSWCVSYGPAPIRWVLPRLGVLWGEWREEQANALMHDAPADSPLATTLQLMVNKGLVLSMKTHAGEPTFTMLDVIRQFAVRRLRTDIGIAFKVYARHAEVFAKELQAIEAGVRSGSMVRFGSIFTAAMPNIRAALRWFLNQQRYPEVVDMVSGLAFPAYQMGYMREALDWVDRTAPYLEQVPLESQMTWYYAEELLAVMLSQYERAIESANYGIPLAQQLGASEYCLRMLSNKALAFQLQGMYPEAREMYEITLNDINVPLMKAMVLNNLGMISMDMGDLDTSLDYHQQSLAIREAANEQFGIGMSLHNLGVIHKRNHEYAKAEALFRQSLNSLRNFTKSVVYAGSLMNLGLVLMKRQPEGEPPSEAQPLMRTAIQILWELGAQRELSIAFEDYAEWLIWKQQFREAAQLIGAVVKVRQAVKVISDANSLARIEEFRTAIEAAIGKRAHRYAEKRGQQRPLADLIGAIEAW